MSAGIRLLTVRHVTVYRYAEPVRLGEHRMMFRPRESHDLRLVQTKLEIVPTPAALRWLHDIFDNSVAIVTFDDATTQELRFDSTVTLEHLETAPPDYALEEAAQMYPFAYSAEDEPDLAMARVRHYQGDAVTQWARGFLSSTGATDTMGLLQAMTIGIKNDFAYARRSEKGVQTPEQTLQRRSGSCRDFAVLMIEAVRSLALAARFVSGYVFVPDAGQPAIASDGATHAWMQVYLPGAGWVDFDPTNSIVGNRNLIRVAVAWDHRQAVPLWGSFIGPASSFVGMNVEVTVCEIDRHVRAAMEQPAKAGCPPARF